MAVGVVIGASACASANAGSEKVNATAEALDAHEAPAASVVFTLTGSERPTLRVEHVDEASGTKFVVGDAFACAETGDGTSRLSCNARTGSATLAVLHRASGDGATVVHWATGYTSDDRTFLRCDAPDVEAAPADRGPRVRRIGCHAFHADSHVNGVFVSPFTSDVPGLSIRNAHLVGDAAAGGARVLRGMAPHGDGDYAELARAGVGEVLLFKDPEPNLPPDRTDTVLEAQALEAMGIRPHDVPFKWKQYPDFATPCAQTIEALRIVKDALASDRSIYFHCTVGEDRTGFLAGMIRMLREGRTHEDVFAREMCEHGYSAGDPQKPFGGVVERIDQDLTPVFTKMAYKIAKGEIAWDRLDPATCAVDPDGDPAYRADARFHPEGFRCLPSSLYVASPGVR
jgi:hypothetical protein